LEQTGLVFISVNLCDSPQIAGKDRSWIGRKPVDSVAILGDYERDVQRRTLLVINYLVIRNRSCAIRIQLLGAGYRLLMRWATTNHHGAAAGKIPFIIRIRGSQ
jgi:hypothetical protein